MAKIIAIENDVITIGTDNGGIKEVRRVDVNFDPKVGDKVDIFETENRTLVSKAEEKQELYANPQNQGGININMVNNQQMTNQQPQYIANGTKAVSKVVYCLLTFFLGGIGVHKFYAGKTGSGILYLLFCWTGIPAFIALIEFIIALCKKADANGMILI